MQKILYIGQYSDGTTSKMRADTLKKLLSHADFYVIDTHIPFYRTNKILRSLGFRYKIGPLIKNINQYIQASLNHTSYDLVWVDKGVFINNKSIRLLRDQSKKLVHFTPDPAFTFHKSRLFNKSLPYYDIVFTTKSFELEYYRQKCIESKVIFITQGFDKNLHIKSEISFKNKRGFLFVGHHETHRELVLDRLLEAGVPVTLAGIQWDSFAQRHQDNKNLNYLGVGVYGEDYVKSIQSAKIAWGALSKWIPELHTTRTFEIPACGTALLTEKNAETSIFFKEDEVIFYNNVNELVEAVAYYLKQDALLESITTKGYDKVRTDGYDYESILKKALQFVFTKI